MANKNKVASTDAPKEKMGFLNKNNEVTSISVIVPPDGGWGWIVMISSMLCNMVVDGIVFSSGILLDSIAKEFDSTKAKVAFVSSLLSGFYLLGGPLVSALANKVGFRITTIIGSITACIGFAISYFASSIYFLYFSYGVTGGLGFCLIYIPSVLSVGYYFEKWRALATGISLCGSGVGTFVFAPLTEILLEEYGWRITLVIQAVIILFCALLGIMFRPLEPTIITSETKNDSSLKIIDVRRPHTDKRTAYSMPTSAHTTWIKHNQSVYPKATDIFSAKDTAELFEMKELQKVEEDDIINDEDTNNSSRTARRHTLSEKDGKHIYIRKRSSGPLNRKDIFFSGSLNRIPQYTSQSSLGYHLSVTNLPEKKQEKEKANIVMKTLSKLLDFSILKSPSFLLLAWSGFFTMSGFFVPFIYINARAKTDSSMQGWDIYLIPAIGISNTVARVLCGLLSSSNKINALLLNNIFISLGGIATICSGFYLTPVWQIGYAIVFGFAIACFSALRSIIVVDLLGLEKLTNAFGMLMMFQGIAAILGSPLAGLFLDLTGSHDAAFYFAGGLIFFSACLCYPLNYMKKMEQKQQNNDS
ncbi:monocarboxylate transporter 14-like [Culicoides brevitarsis]|uniref:monocarboxylate transporter 14-like n=1 Tax=Culicoides brevitarsis TaxID=469753 RepID=UPI00307C591B